VSYIRRVVTTLRANGPMCDDCLSNATKIEPRQRAAMVALDLCRARRLSRKKTTCPQCGRLGRTVTGVLRAKTAPKKGFLAWLLGNAAD
jgi:hypothetical protein